MSASPPNEAIQSIQAALSAHGDRYTAAMRREAYAEASRLAGVMAGIRAALRIARKEARRARPARTDDTAPAAGERNNDRAVGRPLAGVPTSNQLGPNMENVK